MYVHINEYAYIHMCVHIHLLDYIRGTLRRSCPNVTNNTEIPADPCRCGRVIKCMYIFMNLSWSLYLYAYAMYICIYIYYIYTYTYMYICIFTHVCMYAYV